MDYRIFRIAEKNIRIYYRDTYILKLCRGYEAEAEEQDVDLSIRITREEIEKERAKAEKEIEFSDGYLEALAIYRRICDAVLDDHMFLFHCSAVGYDGKAVLFTAPSGTGKSTQASLWAKYLKDRVCIVNDDKPLIQITDQGAMVYGTPWSGKHHRNTNCALPVKAVILLERGEVPQIKREQPGNVYPYLYQQVYKFQEEEKMLKLLKLFNDFVLKIPVYRLKANISEESVKAVREALYRD